MIGLQLIKQNMYLFGHLAALTDYHGTLVGDDYDGSDVVMCFDNQRGKRLAVKKHWGWNIIYLLMHAACLCVAARTMCRKRLVLSKTGSLKTTDN
jgi:hypothetical protein